ncbi:IS110 family RNA-guided transposase [Sphingomonas nostoxanthinifaciens]|uniref:IS110 family transposase n=1 Tax=Sphingomonas nostoxanthinifaciens TaxID=2872652 RepID=UPI001CC1CC15|nr:IS110 family transposase [Sphingomonas nostoxanthinifaciens]UAK23112.1 IS110 family transposase [Sphingomonas nostoxanthinifaciens]
MPQDVVTVGVDLAKNVFQVHAIGADGKVLVRRQPACRRAEVLLGAATVPRRHGSMRIGTSLGRELIALGHDVRLMPPAYVKPYVKRGKTDAADAEAICEAGTRPTMRFVAVKTTEQQAVLMLHKTRDLLVRQRTGLINALRAHLAEYGIISSKGPGGVTVLMKVLHEAQERLPAHARSALHTIGLQLRAIASAVDRLEAQILAWHRSDAASERLATNLSRAASVNGAIPTQLPQATFRPSASPPRAPLPEGVGPVPQRDTSQHFDAAALDCIYYRPCQRYERKSIYTKCYSKAALLLSTPSGRRGTRGNRPFEGVPRCLQSR